MARQFCHTCDVLKEIYWLKASRFLLAVRASARSDRGSKPDDQEVQALKDEALDALRTLLRHMNTCYGFTEEMAA